MSSKKEAGESLTKLKDYLKRDKYAVDLIGSVERFLGELRKERSEIREHVESLSAQVSTHRAARDSAESRSAGLERDVAELKSEAVSLRRSAERDRERLLELQNKYEPPDEPQSLDLLPDEKECLRIANRLMREMPVAPFGGELLDYIKRFSDAEYLKLGMYVVFCCLFFHSFSVGHKGVKWKDLSGKMPSKQMARLVNWLRTRIKLDGGIEGRISEMMSLAKDDAAENAMNSAAVRGSDRVAVGRSLRDSIS